MKTWMKFLAVTLLVGIPAIPLGQMLWPPATTDSMGMSLATPTTMQIILLVVIGVFEGLLFGAGIAFLAFGFPMARKLAAGSSTLTWLVFLGIAWSMTSWWSHDGLHRSMGDDLNALIMVEYGYHVTLMAAAAILAFAFWRVASRGIEQVAATRHSQMPDTRMESIAQG